MWASAAQWPCTRILPESRRWVMSSSRQGELRRRNHLQDRRIQRRKDAVWPLHGDGEVWEEYHHDHSKCLPVCGESHCAGSQSQKKLCLVSIKIGVCLVSLQTGSNKDREVFFCSGSGSGSLSFSILALLPEFPTVSTKVEKQKYL